MEENARRMTSLPTFKEEKSILNPFVQNELPSAELSNERRISVSNFPSSDLMELDKKVKSMMEKGQNMISYGEGKMWTGRVCKVCGKEGQIVSIRDHIEANHLEGIDLPCNFCEKTFRSRSTLRRHMYSHSVKN